MSGATASVKTTGQRKIAAASGCNDDTVPGLFLHTLQAFFRPSSRSLTQIIVGRRETFLQSVVLRPRVMEVRIVDTESGTAVWKKAL